MNNEKEDAWGELNGEPWYLLENDKLTEDLYNSTKKLHRHDKKNSEEWWSNETDLKLLKSNALRDMLLKKIIEEKHDLKMQLRSTKGNLARMSKRYSDLKEHYTELKAKQ